MAITTSRTNELLDLRSQQIPRGVGNAHPIFAARAAGAKVWDIDGKEYIDFVGGIGVLNVGHSHPKVLAAVAEQLERFTHTCFQVAMYEGYVRLAERLNSLAPGTAKKKTLLLTTGAEATENAIKIARAYTNRSSIIAFHHSFHGRTMLALSMTGKTEPYKQRFGPFFGDVFHAPFPYEYHGWTSRRALDALEDLFESETSPDRVAAIIIEPILGEGGFVPAPVDFLQQLRRIADKHGILLIADEIQSGYGRAGKMFAIEYAGIEPDMITVAKSMAAGMPLSAIIGRAEVMDAPTAGGLGGTYAGNPLACAAALAVLDIIEEENLIQRAHQIGAKLEHAMHDLQRRHRRIGDVRGRGAMVAMEFVHEGQPNGTDLAKQVLEEARKRGLLLLQAGTKRNVLRVLVPLIIDDADLDLALSRLSEACGAALPEST